MVAVPGGNGDLVGGGFSMMMMMMIGWLVIATALFFLRPASLRRQSNEKPSGTVSIAWPLFVSLEKHACSLQYYVTPLVLPLPVFIITE